MPGPKSQTWAFCRRVVHTRLQMRLGESHQDQDHAGRSLASQTQTSAGRYNPNLEMACCFPKNSQPSTAYRQPPRICQTLCGPSLRDVRGCPTPQPNSLKLYNPIREVRGQNSRNVDEDLANVLFGESVLAVLPLQVNQNAPWRKPWTVNLAHKCCYAA